MFYTWQSNDGRWQVDCHGSTRNKTARRLSFDAPSFDRKEDAEAWRKEATRKVDLINADLARVTYGENADQYGI